MMIRALLVFSVSVMLASPAHATKHKVDVIGISADMPKIGKTRCVAPGVCLKKDGSGVATYDPGVWGMAKFRPREVTLRDGTKNLSIYNASCRHTGHLSRLYKTLH